MYMFYTIRHFAPNVWYACGTGEHYSPESLPLSIDGFVRFKWETVLIFVPIAAASEMMGDHNKYDACFCIAHLNLRLNAMTDMNHHAIQFASHYSMLQHIHALVVDEGYKVVCVTKDSLFLRASPKGSCWCCWRRRTRKIADQFTLQRSPTFRYHPPELRRVASGHNVITGGGESKSGVRIRRYSRQLDPDA